MTASTTDPGSSRHLQHWWRDDRGSVPEIVILAPVVFFLIFGIIQGALYYQARTVANAAAEEGLRAARTTTGTSGAGQAAAADYLSRNGATLTSPSVTASRTATTATITISGQSQNILPGLDFTVTVRSALPVERITHPGQATG